MFRILKFEPQQDDARYIEASCLSSDTKPTDGDWATGSLCLEADTGDVYAYDEAGSEWNKIASLGGDA